MNHSTTKHKHQPKRRTLCVRELSFITPKMLRMRFEGDDLSDFVSMAPDDHVKLMIPNGQGEHERRDYTPRCFDRETRELAIDFAVHGDGPATRWALAAKVGDMVQIGGPKASTVISPSFGWWLLIGDETALPAIGRCIEELPPGTKVVSLIAVEDAAEEQAFETAAFHQALWVHRPKEQAANPTPLLAALQSLALPKGDGFIWIGAEAGVARSARDYVLNQRDHPRNWVKAAGYWLNGVADAAVIVAD